ncbi:MAG TPA: stalk domain-containing protein [Candidatus Deferrimicrobium sp.]|nr:stalk domain-containing protein [Candidatus Deferrimicrobium sp.]
MSIRNIFDKRNPNIKKILKYAGVHVLDHIIMNHARWECFSFARAGTVQENGGESTVRKLTNLIPLLLIVAMLMVTIAPDCSAEEHASVVQFTVGKTAVTSNGATVLTMPVPAVFDMGSKQLLLPVRSVAKLLEWDLAWDAKTGSCTLTSGKSRVVVKVGSRTAMVGAKAVTMSAVLLNARGTVVGPVDVLRFMGASVQVAPDGRSCTATIASA